MTISRASSFRDFIRGTLEAWVKASKRGNEREDEKELRLDSWPRELGSRPSLIPQPPDMFAMGRQAAAWLLHPLVAMWCHSSKCKNANLCAVLVWVKRGEKQRRVGGKGCVLCAAPALSRGTRNSTGSFSGEKEPHQEGVTNQVCSPDVHGL